MIDHTALLVCITCDYRCDDSEACCETNGKLKCCNAAWVWIIIVIIILVVIGCCCCCCYFIGRSVYQSNSTPVTVQTVRTVEITPSNKQFYTKTTPFNQPSSNRLSIPSAPPSNNYPSIPDAPPSSNHPFIPNDAPPKYSEAIQTSVKTPPSGETEL